MNIKTVLLLSAAVSFAVWSCPKADAANGYEAPLPPPELGEHLTSYRTDNQKKGAPSSVYDRNAGVTGNRKNESSGSGNNRALKEIVTDYVFVPNKNVPVYTGGETVLSFTDRQTGKPLAVSSVSVSNSGFSASSDRSSVIITPTGRNTSAKIRIVLESRSGYPLIFELSYMRSRHNVRNIENIKI